MKTSAMCVGTYATVYSDRLEDKYKAFGVRNSGPADYGWITRNLGERDASSKADSWREQPDLLQIEL